MAEPVTDLQCGLDRSFVASDGACPGAGAPQEPSRPAVRAMTRARWPVPVAWSRQASKLARRGDGKATGLPPPSRSWKLTMVLRRMTGRRGSSRARSGETPRCRTAREPAGAFSRAPDSNGCGICLKIAHADNGADRSGRHSANAQIVVRAGARGSPLGILLIPVVRTPPLAGWIRRYGFTTEPRGHVPSRGHRRIDDKRCHRDFACPASSAWSSSGPQDRSARLSPRSFGDRSRASAATRFRWPGLHPREAALPAWSLHDCRPWQCMAWSRLGCG